MRRFLSVLTIVALLSIGGCASLATHKTQHAASLLPAEFIPAPPDYSDTTMWITQENDSTGTGADVFYIVSTWELDWKTPDGRSCHYADVWNTTHRQHMGIEIRKVANYMADGNNFYSPFYRHASFETWVTRNEDTIAHRCELAMADVKRAFDAFQSRRDRTRPFIIAGFSQGGKAVVELLKYMDDEAYSHLAAAYVLGYKVTPTDTLATSHIRAAQGETDTGVTICYNTVKDVKYIQPVISAPCVMCINPVNWRTDATPAILHDTISVTVSPAHHVLVVKNYAADEYKPAMNFINVGDIHGCEPWLYSDCLRHNIAARTRAWRSKSE